MATKQVVQQKGKQAPAPQPRQNNAPVVPLVFQRENYIIMIVGILVVLLGLILMGGGDNNNPATFPREELYSFRRLTVAPLMIVAGFVIEVFAILKRPKS